MSAKLMGRAFDFELPPRLKLLLLAIADHANDDGLCYPSQKRLATKVSCSERQIRNLLTTLVSENLLEIVERGNGRGKANLYLLPWAVKEEKAEISSIKAETAIAAQPSVQPSSEPPRQSVIDSSSPLPTSYSAKFFAAEAVNEQVAVLVDCAKANGRDVRGGRIAGLLKRHQDNKTAVMLAFMEGIARNVAVIEDYAEGVLGNGQSVQESRRRDQSLDADRGASSPGQQISERNQALTPEEVDRALRDRAATAGAAAEGRGGSRAESPSDA